MKRSGVGGDGKVVTPFTAASLDEAYAVAFEKNQPTNNKIVAVGRSGPDSTANFAIVRYHANGVIDKQFTTEFGTGNDQARSVVALPGKIVVAGFSSGDFALARYNSTATELSLDAAFGNLGKVTTDFEGGVDEGHAVGLQPDGQIVVAGFGTRADKDLCGAKLARAPPTVASLSGSPDPVTQSNTLTLTANGVADSDGTVSAVEFYRDINNNSVLDVGIDQLLGEDTGHGGWTWSGSSVDFLWERTVFCRAQDDVAPTATRSPPQASCKPPTIASLSDSPDPVTQSNTLTSRLTAVADSDGTVTRVEFYRDINNNSVLEVGTDQLLGEDTSATGGWTWSGSSGGSSFGDEPGLCPAQDNVGPTATRSPRLASCKRRRRSPL